MVKKAAKPVKETRPASNPESREQQLVSLAINLAEEQLKNGTAAPSVINHFLKIGSTRESIERDILEKQAKFLEAKAETINKDRDAQDLAKAAIEAMKNYNSGS